MISNPKDFESNDSTVIIMWKIVGAIYRIGVFKTKNPVSRYDKLHSFIPMVHVISLKVPYTCKVFNNS